jgi:homopolymeric O-antigen transport system permease protein
MGKQNDQLAITTYDAREKVNWGQVITGLIKGIIDGHGLGVQLFKRNLKAQYRQSLLGFAWALLPPIIVSVTWIVLQGSKVINVAVPGISYPVFVMTGTLLWQIFTDSVLMPLKNVTLNKSILVKINFPREALLISGVYEVLFNVLIKVGILVLIYVWFNQSIGFTILYGLLGIFCLMSFGLGIGILLTPIGMLYQDIQRGITILMPFLMYLTPVIYPMPATGRFAAIMQFNPLAGLIPVIRNWLTLQTPGNMDLFVMYSIIGFVLLFLSLIVYRVAVPIIIERIGA